MERDKLEKLGVDGRILKWISRKWDWWFGLDLAVPGYGHVVGSCACGNESPGSIKCRECLE
jgi:hypothetical protein